MKVGFDAFFSNTVFEGPVSFIVANILSAFYADHAQFKNKEKTANFEAMKVGVAAFFRKTVFEGPANFIAADIGKELHMEEAQFRNPGGFITFNVMKVEGGVMFEKAVFQGPVDLQQADITGEFRAHEAQFKNKERGARFAAMKVGSQASFYKTVFEGPVDFSYSEFAWLDLSRVDFSYSEFAWLDLSSPFWPKAAPKFHMQGMNYKYVRAAPNEPESHEALLKLANRSAYTGDVYSNLEAFFSRQGYHADADRAFIAGKCRERKEYLHGLRWLGSWLLYLLVGYGRHPSQAGYLCVFFVVLGCFLFSPRKMEPQKPEDAARVYNRFWYSLGLFLPFVDLQADKVWKPKNDRRFLRHYMRLHILLGWILIPIFLAALTAVALRS